MVGWDIALETEAYVYQTIRDNQSLVNNPQIYFVHIHVALS